MRRASRPSWASPTSSVRTSPRLRRYCEPGEHFYCDGWTGASAGGLEDRHRSDDVPDGLGGGDARGRSPRDALPLGPEHASQMFELVALTHPGPFGPRTPELGEYFGVLEGDRLIAMAGERMQAGDLREISGVCTHPERQGRGLARAWSSPGAAATARGATVPARDARQRARPLALRAHGLSRTISRSRCASCCARRSGAAAAWRRGNFDGRVRRRELRRSRRESSRACWGRTCC